MMACARIGLGVAAALLLLPALDGLRPRSFDGLPTSVIGARAGTALPGLAASALETFSGAAGVALAAQQAGGTPPRVRADTLSADSARARVLERLRRLAAPPPRDTMPDSLRADHPDAEGGPEGDPATGAQQRGPDGRPGGAPAGRVGGAPTDSVMQALMELPGYSISRYQGEHVDFGGEDRILNLYGDADSPARFQREDLDLSADSAISYNEREGRVRTVGDNTFSSREGEPVSSRILIYDLAEARGTALGAETRYSEGGAEWFVSGDLTSVEDGRVWGSHARFTSCELEVPHSHFVTNEIKIVAGRVLVARPVTMYFADVPVFWLPFMAQTLGDGRGSGLLTPRFSVNDIVRTSTGYNRRVSNIGFYWAMSDYTDATMAFDWWSNRYKAITGNLRYNWMQQFLRGDVSFRRYWREGGGIGGEGGGTELAFNSQNSWEYDERTRLNVSASYISNSSFVQQNSFDPREVTQSIDSRAGLNRRFDWGNFSSTAQRRHYLSDDRVELEFPRADLSISPVTLFDAPPNEAGPFNNMTWSGRGNIRRTSTDRRQDPGEDFSLSLADESTFRGEASSTLSIGNFSWSQSGDFNEATRRSVPDTLFPAFEPPEDPLEDPALRDLAVSAVNWSTTFSYRQRLIGTTNLTPRVSLSGQALRSDTIPEAASFVSGPTRVSFGAQLQTDIFGFYPGVAGFSAIRHKLTPVFSYSYTPTSQPTDLQRRVFGSQELQARNQITVRLNQTFEAKVREDEDEADPEDQTGEPDEPGVAAGEPAEPGEPLEFEATTEEDEPGQTGTAGEPRRLPRDRIVNLLRLQTSAVTYDFVRADTLGFFTGGFTTARIRNQISTDYLRGLTLSMEHDIFSEVREDGELLARSFAPHLSQLSFSFSVGSRTSLFRKIFGGGEDVEADEEDEEDDEGDEDEDDLFESRDAFDELRMMPERREEGGGVEDRSPRRESPLGEWNANLSYSLRRPRPLPGQEPSVRPLNAQMIEATVTFKPTENWDVSWRTAYDLERGTFNDHMIRLSRDLHEWEASFDFRQTLTGNWSFRFEVSLIANRDLKFDFEQRNLDSGFQPVP